jgi:Flp pilus assembly protein TadG
VRFWRDERGGVALIAAFALPTLLVMVVAAIELHALHGDRQKLQDVADGTALMAASQMRLAANNSVLERARSFATESLEGLHATPDEPVVEFLETSDSSSSVRVALTARRTSFFGNLLPVGGFVVSAESTAVQLATAPLCVLGLGSAGPNALDFPNANVMASACLVHSNKSIALGGPTSVTAAAVQAVGSITGSKPANSGTGAPPVPDPLAVMFNGAGPGMCDHTSNVKVDHAGQAVEVDPGVHCRHFDIEKGTLRFRPGVHHLKNGELQLKKGAKIEGENVTLVIWKALKIDFSDGQVDLLHLTGSQGGAGEMATWAGFALAVDPTRGGDLTLNFREIRRLEGVVYAPGVRLVVPGGINPTEVTPWTVIVARDFRVEGGRALHINADYANSSVPVPSGVGNRAAGGAPIRLVN